MAQLKTRTYVSAEDLFEGLPLAVEPWFDLVNESSDSRVLAITTAIPEFLRERDWAWRDEELDEYAEWKVLLERVREARLNGADHISLDGDI